MRDAYLPIGDIGQTVFIGKFQGVREGHFRDCTDVEIRKGGRRVAAVRLSGAEVKELIGLLANAIRDDIPVR